MLFAKTDKEYQKKTKKLEKEKQNNRQERLGKFTILEDTRYCGEGRKLFVRSCDGYYIRTFYFTPYLASDAHISGHHKIGESFVNKYGQDMPNPYAFKMPKQRKPRYVFRINSKIMNLNDNEVLKTFVELIKPQGYDLQEVIVLYSIFQTKRRRAILCDWLIRKYLRKKSFKIPFNELASMEDYIKHWERKHC